MLVAVVMAAGTFLWQALGQAIEDPGPKEAVKVKSVSILRNQNQGGTYLFAKPMDFTGAELLEAGRTESDAWFRKRGGVDPDESEVQVILEGQQQGTVRITGLDVTRHCTRPLTGTLMLSPPGGSDDTIRIGVDLDAARIIPHDIAGDDPERPFFAEHTVSLAEKEQVVLNIVASTGKHYCTVSYTLNVLTDDGTQRLKIDNAGKPFEVSAVPQIEKADGEVMHPMYERLYVGGVLTTSDSPAFVPKDPKTYHY